MREKARLRLITSLERPPCFQPFMLAMALPASVLGPVDRSQGRQL